MAGMLGADRTLPRSLKADVVADVAHDLAQLNVGSGAASCGQPCPAGLWGIYRLIAAWVCWCSELKVALVQLHEIKDFILWLMQSEERTAPKLHRSASLPAKRPRPEPAAVSEVRFLQHLPFDSYDGVLALIRTNQRHASSVQPAGQAASS